MAYPHNEQTIQEVDPMTARNVLGWLGQLVELPGQMKSMQDQAERDRQSYAEQVQRLEAKIAEVVAKNGELSDRVAKIAQENENLKSENRWLSNSLEGSRQEVRTLNDTIRVKNTEITGLERAISDLNGQLDSAKRVNVDLSADVIDRDEEIASLKAMVARLQGKIDRMVKVAQDELEALTADAKEGQPPEQNVNTVTGQDTGYRPFAAVSASGQGQGGTVPAYSFEGQRDPEHEADRRERGVAPEKGHTSFDPFAA